MEGEPHPTTEPPLRRPCIRGTDTNALIGGRAGYSKTLGGLRSHTPYRAGDQMTRPSPPGTNITSRLSLQKDRKWWRRRELFFQMLWAFFALSHLSTFVGGVAQRGGCDRFSARARCFLNNGRGAVNVHQVPGTVEHCIFGRLSLSGLHVFPPPPRKRTIARYSGKPSRLFGGVKNREVES